jgi:hypothetical protein
LETKHGKMKPHVFNYMEEQMTEWTAGTCEANGINMHYLRTGGNKPPVVLLHGLMTPCVSVVVAFFKNQKRILKCRQDIQKPLK